MQNFTLYTNDCPKCRILKAKLDEKDVIYNVCNDIELMLSKGFKTMPMLEVDGVTYDFLAAVNLIKEI